MAHTYGQGGRIPASGTTTTANPATASINLAAGRTVLWVSIVVAGTTARAGGAPTFNGVALTASNAKANAGGTPETNQEDWYLLDPPTGSSYTLSIPNTGALAMAIAWGAASAASGYTSVLDSGVSTPGNSTNPSTSFTVADGAIWFGGVGNGATTWNPSGRSGTQINDWDAGSWGRGAQYGIKSGAGSQTVSWTFGTSEDWIIQATSFKEQLLPVTGSGTPDAQAATLDGAGTSSSAGTGSLAAQSAALDGAGTAGDPAITGTGGLAATAASADGAGAVLWVASGALQAQASSLDGIGLSASRGTGTLSAQAADSAGSGASASAGAGAAAAQAGALDGSGSVGYAPISGAGTLSAAVSSADGQGESLSTAQGVLQGQSSAAIGSGASAAAGSGGLAGQAAAVEGGGTSASSGVGVLDAQLASADGSGLVFNAGEIIGEGGLVASAAGIAGTGEVAALEEEPQERSGGGVVKFWDREPRAAQLVTAAAALSSGAAALQGSGVVTGLSARQRTNRKTLAMLLAA